MHSVFVRSTTYAHVPTEYSPLATPRADTPSSNQPMSHAQSVCVCARDSIYMYNSMCSTHNHLHTTPHQFTNSSTSTATNPSQSISTGAVVVEAAAAAATATDSGVTKRRTSAGQAVPSPRPDPMLGSETSRRRLTHPMAHHHHQTRTTAFNSDMVDPRRLPKAHGPASASLQFARKPAMLSSPASPPLATGSSNPVPISRTVYGGSPAANKTWKVRKQSVRVRWVSFPKPIDGFPTFN